MHEKNKKVGNAAECSEFGQAWPLGKEMPIVQIAKGNMLNTLNTVVVFTVNATLCLNDSRKTKVGGN